MKIKNASNESKDSAKNYRVFKEQKIGKESKTERSNKKRKEKIIIRIIWRKAAFWSKTRKFLHRGHSWASNFLTFFGCTTVFLFQKIHASSQRGAKQINNTLWFSDTIPHVFHF